MKINKSTLISLLKVVFPIALLLLIFFESKSMVKQFDLNLLKDNISELNLPKILAIILLGIAAITPMLFYDLVLCKILNLKLKYRKVFSYSWIVNSFSNFLGLGGVIGLSLRAFFYENYYKEKDAIMKSIAKVSIFYISGISILCWLVALHISKPTFLIEMKWLEIAVWAIALYIPFLLLGIRLKNYKKDAYTIKNRYLIELMVVSLTEWMSALILFWGIAHLVNVNISFAHLFPIFIVSACAGIISMIPGGLGSFDLVLLMGFEYYNVPSEKVLLVLLLYRISYYLIPFIIGVFLFIKHFWDKLDTQYKQIFYTVFRNTGHWVLTILVFFSGIILLLSASLPGVLDRIKFLRGFLASPIMDFSHQLTVVFGFLLILLSRGIEYKVRWAYYTTIIILILASLLCLVKGLDYEEAIYLSFVALMLGISKNRFYRINLVVTWGRVAIDFFVIIFFTCLYILIGYYNLPKNNLKVPKFLQKYMIVDTGDLIYSAVIGLIIALIIMVCAYILSRPKPSAFYLSNNQTEKIITHLNDYGGTVLSHLIFLHDKKIYWSKTGSVMLMFEKYADKLVILGNPTGDEHEFFHTIEEFHDFADLYGFTPVYYQVSKEMLPKLHENGYDFFKLGEEAFVNLNTFSLTGKKMKGLRASKNKFEREGYTFQIFQPPFSSDFYESIKDISRQWLNGKKEKGFSLGFYNEQYLETAPVAIVNDSNNKTIAFASIMPVYDNHATLSIDLMRYLPEAPPGTMDYVFLELFEWAKLNGYQRFNLGMAPLANVGMSRYSFTGEKVASQIFSHGNFVYHFKGLKKFKEKYAEIWEPKYLAYRKKTSLPLTVLQIALLISKKRPES